MKGVMSLIGTSATCRDDVRRSAHEGWSGHWVDIARGPIWDIGRTV